MSAIRNSLKRHDTALPARNQASRQGGKIGWVLLWLVGIPIPLLLVLFLFRGCT